MIIDCRTWEDLPDRGESQRRTILVNGREMTGVWYVDTEQGLVKTYHILFDAQPEVLERYRFGKYSAEDMRRMEFASRQFMRSMLVPPEWEIETEGDIVSRTVRGKVELLRPPSAAE